MSLPSSPASPLSEASLSPPTVAGTEAVVAQVSSVIEAELIRGRLQAAGIEARLADTHTAGLGPHLTAAIGGVRVIVHRDVVEEAHAILADVAHTLEAEDDVVVDAALPRRRPADTAARWSLVFAQISIPFPFIGHACSALLAVRALNLDDQLSARGKKTLAGAIAVDVASAALWWGLLS